MEWAARYRYLHSVVEEEELYLGEVEGGKEAEEEAETASCPLEEEGEADSRLGKNFQFVFD